MSHVRMVCQSCLDAIPDPQPLLFFPPRHECKAPVQCECKWAHYQVVPDEPTQEEVGEKVSKVSGQASGGRLWVVDAQLIVWAGDDEDAVQRVKVFLRRPDQFVTDFEVDDPDGVEMLDDDG